MKKLKRFPTKVLIAHAKAHPATADYAFGDWSGGYTIGKRTKLINHATVQKIVVGCQVATLVLELNGIIADEDKDREARAVGAIMNTLRDIQATLRTRG